MAIRKPIVITSTGNAELPAGDTLPVSMQDAYDSGKTITLASTTDPIRLKQTAASGTPYVLKFEDLSGNDYGLFYFYSLAWGLHMDIGEAMSLNAYGGSSRVCNYQSTKANGTRASPTAAGNAEEIVKWLAYTHNGIDYRPNAKASFYTTEAQGLNASGCEYKIEVTKNGTSSASRFTAFTVTNDGNIKAFNDFIARNAYKVPFILYALPSPYNMTGSATETKISSDISVPANTLSSNSKLKTDILTSCTTTANAKYVIVRFGPNANNTDPVMLYFNFGGVLSQHIFDTLTCRNSNTDKIGFLSWTSSSIGTSSTSKSIAMQTISVNNTVQNYITIWLKNGQTTDNSTLQMLTIEVIP